MSKRSRQAHETPVIEEVTEVDTFEPDYESRCLNCGETPTVLGLRKGQVVYAAGLCGVCTWGEADGVDPANW